MSKKLLRLDETIKKTGIPKSSIYAKLARNEFPKPIKLGIRSIAFIEEEINRWIEERIKDSRPAQ